MIKTANMSVTCFCHYSIFAKTGTKMTKATMLSHQSDIGLHALTVSLLEKLMNTLSRILPRI